MASTNSAQTLDSNWPKGNPNDAYAQYFTGNSYLAPIQPKNLVAGDKTIQGYSNVTFEPGCRNNWHIHHGAHQILICVSGEGIYQEWGKPAIHLHAGDIIDIPEGVKHWHGATKDSWFQHLASHVHVSDPESNEWLEPVSDEQYASANHAAVRIHAEKDKSLDLVDMNQMAPEALSLIFNKSNTPSFQEIASSRPENPLQQKAD